MLITLVVALIIIALIWWVITQLPLPPMIRTVATVIFVVAVVLWLLQLIGHPVGGLTL